LRRHEDAADEAYGLRLSAFRLRRAADASQPPELRLLRIDAEMHDDAAIEISPLPPHYCWRR